jgi:hypothetical protein
MHRTLKARLCRLERATAAKQTRPFGFVLRATDEADADREWAAIKTSSALDGVEEPIPLVRVFIPEPAEPATAWRRRFNQIAGPHQLRCVPSSRSTLANSIATNAAACSFHFSVPSGAANQKVLLMARRPLEIQRVPKRPGAGIAGAAAPKRHGVWQKGSIE